MKRQWGLAIFILLLAIVFVSGCAKKSVLKEAAAPKEPAVRAETKPAVKVPEKSAAKADAEAKKAAERAEREAALKDQAQKEAAAKKKAAEKAAAEKLYELSDIYFDFDKFSLSGDAREILKKHAAWLNDRKEAMIVVEGHCDERGTAEYNLALGQRRATAAAKFLTDLQIDEKRIKTISYGSERPVDPRHNEEAWAKNRRAHFAISGTK